MSYQIRAQPRRDPGEDDIIAALEAAGCIVKKLSTKGMPDLMVFVPGTAAEQGVIALLEVKAPAGPRGGASANGQRLKPEQAKFFDLVKGKRLPIYVVRTPAEAVAAVQEARR